MKRHGPACVLLNCSPRGAQPANVLVGANGALKLGDLGLGRQLSEQTMEAFSKVRPGPPGREEHPPSTVVLSRPRYTLVTRCTAAGHWHAREREQMLVAGAWVVRRWARRTTCRQRWCGAPGTTGSQTCGAWAACCTSWPASTPPLRCGRRPGEGTLATARPAAARLQLQWGYPPFG